MKKTDPNKKARQFLCVVLAAVVLFVAAICVFISARNKKIEAGDIKITQQAPVSQEPQKAGKTDGKITDTAKESSGETTQPSTADTTEATTAKAEETTEKPAESTTEKEKKSGSIFNPTLITPKEDDWYLTLINSNYVLPEDYSPDLVYVCSGSEQLDKKVAPYYEKMYNAALKDGVTLTPCSGYRSYELQKRNYNNKTSYYESLGYSHEDALIKAATIIMPPGSSEHNLGYAMDIVCVEEWFEDTEEFTWLNEHAADYGFILRYPADKTDITKVTYEPWHWRYVGVEDAKAIKASGQVLEEYLGEN